MSNFEDRDSFRRLMGSGVGSSWLAISEDLGTNLGEWKQHPEGGYERDTPAGHVRLAKTKTGAGWELLHKGKAYKLGKKASFDHADKIVLGFRA